MPFINTSLRNIASGVQDINNNVTPYVVGIVKPLAADELANVPVLLKTTKALVESIKNYAAAILFGLTTGKSFLEIGECERRATRTIYT